jgi:hypothetical protein
MSSQGARASTSGSSEQGQGFISATMAQENHQRLHGQSPQCLTSRSLATRHFKAELAISRRRVAWSGAAALLSISNVVCTIVASRV